MILGSKKTGLLGIVGGFRGAGQQGIDPGQQVERWGGVFLQHIAEIGGPMGGALAFLAGKNERDFRKTTAARELLAGAPQPAFEIGAFGASVKHVWSASDAPAGRQGG